MRHWILIALVSASAALAGCQQCEYPSSFHWMSRLVPTEGQETMVSGTGATEYVAASPAPMHTHPDR